MAVEMPVFTKTFLAAADLSAKQFYFVKQSAAGKVNVCAAVTDVPVGVLQNAPKSGEAAVVMVIGESKISADSELAVGNIIGTSADGQADPITAGTDTTVYVAGQVTVAAGAANGIGSALINCASPGRAA